MSRILVITNKKNMLVMLPRFHGSANPWSHLIRRFGILGFITSTHRNQTTKYPHYVTGFYHFYHGHVICITSIQLFTCKSRIPKLHIKVRWRGLFFLFLHRRVTLQGSPAGAKTRKIAPVSERKYVASQSLSKLLLGERRQMSTSSILYFQARPQRISQCRCHGCQQTHINKNVNMHSLP